MAQLRVVVIALAFANLLALAVWKGWLGGGSYPGEPERLSNQLNPERMRLVAEAPLAVPTPAPAPVAAAPAPAAPVNAAGEGVYKKVCALCHSSGVAGAPKPGDKADWEPRIAQGDETLYKHAIEGYTGPGGGVMPPKGGNAGLSEEQIHATVDWMLANLK